MGGDLMGPTGHSNDDADKQRDETAQLETASK